MPFVKLFTQEPKLLGARYRTLLLTDVCLAGARARLTYGMFHENRSACETGVGAWVSGEGVPGIPFALFAAGNGNTILTLWPIYDGSTSEFTNRLFKKLSAGSSLASGVAEPKR